VTDDSGRSPISRLQRTFQKIVDEHYAPLWSYVSVLTGGSPDGEDILHQAFLLAFDRLADGDRTIESMDKWLRGVVRNLVRAWWREKRSLPASLADRLYELAEVADSAASAPANAELTSALERCLGQLAPAARRFVEARYEKGLPINKIARQEGLNEATARVRLFRIRQALKACLQTTMAEGAIG
jgi:RNA polymerase sigma-70 factor (ECF subfamily)